MLVRPALALVAMRRRNSSASAGARSARAASTSSKCVATRSDSRCAERADSDGRRTSGSCQSGCSDRSRHQSVERRFPDLRRRIGEHGVDRRAVRGCGDGVRHAFLETLAARDRKHGPRGRRVGDEAEERSSVVKQRRKENNRFGDGQRRVVRQAQDQNRAARSACP